jgi:hypothetical protein
MSTARIIRVLIASFFLSVLAAPVAEAQGKKAKTTKKPRRLAKLQREAPRMTNELMGKHLKSLSGNTLKGQKGQWSFTLNGVAMSVVTDSRADRMRIVSPIVSVDKLDRSDLLNLLEANFDRALDAKYTVFDGTVWAAFVHPLSPLTRGELVSAAKQVAALSNSFGTTFSSLDIVFGNP